MPKQYFIHGHFLVECPECAALLFAEGKASYWAWEKHTKWHQMLEACEARLKLLEGR